MESPEQTLLRALVRLDTTAERMREDNCTVEDMRKQIEELQDQLSAKTELCRKLQLALTELLAREPSTVNSYASVGAVRGYDVSSEHLMSVLTQFKNQVWFSTKPPKLVDAIFLRLSSSISDSIKNGERQSALTFEECTELVETEVRVKWEAQLPSGITSFLGMNIHVYQSHAAVLAKADGKPCEPVHFLVYIVRKLHNHITHLVFNLRKSQEKKIGKGSFDLANEGKADDGEKEGRLRWQDNPIYNAEFMPIHEASRKASDCMSSNVDCTQALTASITKLVSKPVLVEVIRHISSVVSLQEKAAKEGWSIPHSMCGHRQSFPNKMLEVWMRLKYRKDLQSYREDIFRGLNSLLMLVAIRDGKEGMHHLLAILLSSVKSTVKPRIVQADVELSTNGNIRPLFDVLHDVASNTEVVSFYVHVFIKLLQFFAGDDTVDESEPETILLNLLRDLNISQGKLSSLESHGYIKVISIISSTILPGMTSSTSHHLSTPRARYLGAAQQIGSKLYYQMRVRDLTPEEEHLFWTQEDSLVNICGASALQRQRNTLPQLLLPKLPSIIGGESCAESSSVSVLQSKRSTLPQLPAVTGAENRTGRGISVDDKDTDSLEEPVDDLAIADMPPKDLKKMLRARNLPDYGAKPVLVERLLKENRKRKEGPEADRVHCKKRNTKRGPVSLDVEEED